MERPKKRRRVVSYDGAQIAKGNENFWNDLIPFDVWNLIFVMSDGATQFVLSFTTHVWHDLWNGWNEIGKTSSLHSIVKTFSRDGFLNLLIWWVDLGFFIGTNVCIDAAANDDMVMMEWAIGKGCELTKWVSAAAAVRGNVEMLKWLVGKACPAPEPVCAYLASRGDLTTLEWAVQNGCECTFLTGKYAAEKGQLGILQWLNVKGLLKIDNYLADNAARGGHLEVLKWLKTIQPSIISVLTSTAAASFGRLEILKWLIEDGCRWDAWALAMAARCGHFDVFKWAVENGCDLKVDVVLTNVREKYTWPNYKIHPGMISDDQVREGRRKIEEYLKEKRIIN
jgi:hypothetical protein